MRIHILSSCTSEKSVSCEHPLTLDDLQRGGEHLATRRADLVATTRPARDLYRGQQHVRLMRGVATLEERADAGEDVPTVEVSIASAGFGLVRADEVIPPYDITFAGMAKADLRTWADQLGLVDDVATALAQPADLHLVLLGDDYAEAAGLDQVTAVGGPSLWFTSAKLAEALMPPPDVRVIPISRQTPRAFGTNLIGVRGEIAGRLLVALTDDPGLLGRLLDPAFDLVRFLAGEPKVSDPAVDWVVSVPPPRPEVDKLRYFIPDWDDLVDSEYDFDEEVYSRGGGGWDREVYAHQLLERPAYDGILVSREVVRKSKKKRRHLEGLVGRGGIHRYLRVPERFPVLGDCGAFGYAKEDEPPYTTDDVLDYYERLGFNYGVSVDHLVALAPNEAARRSRYELTLANAEAFLREHRAQGLAFRPIGAVQGWDLHTYREAARQTVAMGYDYIAIGGLVQTRTEEVLAVLEAVHDVVPPSVEVHAFGLARLEATADLVRLGVTSIDSASPLRKAWLDSANNYWTLDGVTYAAIRVPSPPKTMPNLEKATKREQAALEAVRAVASSAGSVEDALCALKAHHTAIEEHKRDLKVEKRRREQGITAEEDNDPLPKMKPFMRDHYLCILEERPWERCPCAVCRGAGVEVAIFRGNNRNRRRGFHNTYVFYELLGRALGGEEVNLTRAVDLAPLPLFR